MLKVDIADLEAADFDMDLPGFSEKEMKSMFGEAETGEDNILYDLLHLFQGIFGYLYVAAIHRMLLSSVANVSSMPEP